MAIDEPNFSTFGRLIQEDEWVIFLKILKGFRSPKSPDFGALYLLLSNGSHPTGMITRWTPPFFTVAGLRYNEAGNGTLSFPLEILEGDIFLSFNEKHKKASPPKNQNTTQTTKKRNNQSGASQAKRTDRCWYWRLGWRLESAARLF
jgi:hypothetical protein